MRWVFESTHRDVTVFRAPAILSSAGFASAILPPRQGGAESQDNDPVFAESLDLW
jgi:hypothetical protein